MIEIQHLDGGYKTFQVIYDVSLSVPAREITVILGPNGSGKSTLLKCIAGLATIFSGEITLEHMSLANLPVHNIARLGIVYIAQTRNVFGGLSLRENLRMAGYIQKSDVKSKMERVASLFPALEGSLDRKAKTLSGGERQMLAIAMGLMREPKIMLLDEPTANLAPIVVAEVLQIVKDLKNRVGLGVLMVEQNAQRALEIADRACLLVAGRLVFNGSPKDLLENRELSKLYLGSIEASA